MRSTTTVAAGPAAYVRTVLACAIDHLAERIECRKTWDVPSNRLDLLRTIAAERLCRLSALVDSKAAHS